MDILCRCPRVGCALSWDRGQLVMRAVVILVLSCLGCGGAAEAEDDAGAADASTSNADGAADSRDASPCPSAIPVAGASCAGTPDCFYPCKVGATGAHATCGNGAWVVWSFSCAPEAGPEIPAERTVGAECKTSEDCDPFGYGSRFCSVDNFTSGPLNPTPICVGFTCSAKPDALAPCDGGAGICLPAASLCMGACVFDASSKPGFGCRGTNACNPYVWSGTGSMVRGFGYCFGGCRRDLDCPPVTYCQLETGLCMKATAKYSLAQGVECTKADAIATPPKCDCYYDRLSLAGYCANHCRTGGTDCPSGSLCDADMPTVDDDGLPITTTLPAGLIGRCLKLCSDDADCLGGTRCSASGGSTTRVCRVDHRYP